MSIPLGGAKRSLNVSVAFGILMHAWREALTQGAERRSPLRGGMHALRTGGGSSSTNRTPRHGWNERNHRSLYCHSLARRPSLIRSMMGRTVSSSDTGARVVPPRRMDRGRMAETSRSGSVLPGSPPRQPARRPSPSVGLPGAPARFRDCSQRTPHYALLAGKRTARWCAVIECGEAQRFSALSISGLLNPTMILP